jgi:PAS domain S-box-containing protein
VATIPEVPAPGKSMRYYRLRQLPALHAVSTALLVCAAYFVAAEIGLALTMRPRPVSTLWPPNALLLALLLLTPTRSWWAVLLAAFPAHLAVELKGGIPLPMVLCWFISNCSEALIGAGVIRRLGGLPTRFDTVRWVGIFVFGSLVAVVLSSFLDATFVELNAWGTSTYWETWRLRTFSNLLATLTLVPVIVATGTERSRELEGRDGRRSVEAVVLVASVVAVSILVFTGQAAGPNTTPALLYAPLPLLLWAAVRFGPAATSGCMLVVALVAVWGAIRGDGPFVTSTPEQNALSLQLFLIVIAVPLMTLAALTQERLRAQEDARQSEERLRLAMSAVQLGAWEWDIRRQVATWSEKSAEIFGLAAPPRGLTVARFLELVSPEDRPAVSVALRRAFLEGAPFDTEYRITLPDGETRWVLAKGKPSFDHAGRPVRLIGVHADVTERRRAYAAVSEWENRYEAAVQASNQVLYDWDPRTNDVTWGGNVERLLGYSREEMAGGLSRWVEQIHPADRQAFHAEVDRVIVTEDSFRLTYRVYHKDGRIIWLQDRGHFFRDGAGRVSRMVGFLEDISERMATDQALRSSEERFAKAFRSSPDAILIARLVDGRILEVNDTWEAMFGHQREHAVGRTAAELGMYANPGNDERLHQLLAEGTRVSEHELELRTSTGDVRQAILAADTVEVSGEPCFITFIRDVTERKRAEAEAQEQRREVAHLSRVAVLGELSGALAHELNQPLTAILANARAGQRLLRSDTPDLPELRGIVEDIANDDRRAGEVIERLRAFLRKGDMQSGPLDINAVVDDVLQLVPSDLIQRRVTVESRLAPSLPPVFGDRVQLQQVVLNLLLNACEAMSVDPSNGSRVTIQTAATEDGAVKLSLADQGMGIPEQMRDRIFDPFVTSKPHGLGLGLSICRSIVTAHGGRLWADNNEDGGATFHLLLHGETSGQTATAM